ncbi:MAG: hypothetical protein NZ898_16330 [Myxococcota bacterium]|nr:hypothetical protein [Myxococcota bacterium]MDW8361473.1 hypothetical protein [Myxococcales bacterium]
MKPIRWIQGVLWVAAAGCATSYIPNTTVEDNDENRQVIEFMERYRLAVERRDAGALLAMASRRYYDDAGTPGTEDDLDYERLQRHLVAMAERLDDVRYEIRYRRVTHTADRVLVDFTYTGSFRLREPPDHWARRIGDNRVVLARENGSFRILSGM